MGFGLYLLFQGLIAVSILGIVLDYVTGQWAITTGILVGVMILTAAYLAFGVWYLWRRLYRPLQRLKYLSERWAELKDPATEALSLPGVIRGVAKSVGERMAELDKRSDDLQKSDTERTESHIRAGLLADICRAGTKSLTDSDFGAAGDGGLCRVRNRGISGTLGLLSLRLFLSAAGTFVRHTGRGSRRGYRRRAVSHVGADHTPKPSADGRFFGGGGQQRQRPTL